MKKLIKNIYLFVASSALLTMVSCEDLKFGNDFLQKAPSSDVTIDTIFSSAEYARRVLWYSYTKLPYGLSDEKYALMKYANIDGLTDLAHCEIGDAHIVDLYYKNEYNAQKENEKSEEGGRCTKCGYDKATWTAIRNAWLLVENVDKVAEMDGAEKSRLKAEAKMIVAIYYAHWLRHFGALPIVDHALTATEEMPKRATLQATVDFIVGLLDEAIQCPEFPWTIEESERENWDGRMTKAGAMGLKARVLLFVASPLFNDSQAYWPGEAANQKMTWFGNYDKERWKLAVKACEEFFAAVQANGFYKLVEKDEAAGVYPGYKNEYRYAFRAAYFDRGTTETLISVRRGIFDTNGLKEQDRAIRWGAHNPTLEYLDMFPYADGSMPDWDAERAAGKNILADRDPRFYETFIVDGDMFDGKPNFALHAVDPKDPENYPKSKEYGDEYARLSLSSLKTGIAVRKWGLDRWAEWKDHIIQWPHLRMAELYLTYAEALNEYHGAPNAKAYEAINTVRARVGLSPLSGLSYKEFHDAVLRERACEFGYEEVRFFDLIRWKMKEKFTTPLHGMNTYKHKDTGVNRFEVFPLKGTVNKDRAWWEPGIFKEKSYLSAFPSLEVNKGYGLIQNPGWE